MVDFDIKNGSSRVCSSPLGLGLAAWLEASSEGLLPQWQLRVAGDEDPASVI